MKAKIYTNCSLVRIPVKQGEREYFFAQNVNWAADKVDQIIVVAPEGTCVDPVDGVTPVMDAATLANFGLFATLYDSESKELMHNVSYEQIFYRNNQLLQVNAQLNLSLCKLAFTKDPDADYTLLLYVFHQTRVDEYYEVPKRAVTTRFPLAANQEISLRQIIHDYVHALPSQIQGIICWDDSETYPSWITLRDKKLTYTMAHIYSGMCKGTTLSTPEHMQINPFALNDLDIDFDNSYIREAAGQSSTQQITFLYK